MTNTRNTSGMLDDAAWAAAGPLVNITCSVPCFVAGWRGVFSLDVIVPDFRLDVINGAETVGQMARAVATDAQGRLRQGKGAVGALPKPKAGGRPLNRTGTLISSISAQVSRRKPERWIVRATGDRGNAIDNVAKIAGARLRQKTARSQRFSTWLASNPKGLTLSRRDARKASRANKIKIRAVTKNAQLLAVLANPPKDKRAKGGHRAVYRVLESTPRSARIAAEVAAKTLRYELRASGGGR